MSCKNAYMRSTQCCYNNATQNVEASGTVLAILGSTATDTGIAIESGTNGFTVTRSGSYRFSADVVFTASSAGTLVSTMTENGNALPCTTAQTTTLQNGVYSIHMETVLFIRTCPMTNPQISVQLSGVAGTVSHISANSIKIA